jgi:hypothetical protein
MRYINAYAIAGISRFATLNVEMMRLTKFARANTDAQELGY